MKKPSLEEFGAYQKRQARIDPVQAKMKWVQKAWLRPRIESQISQGRARGDSRL
jgi:hypothetical protein